MWGGGGGTRAVSKLHSCYFLSSRRGGGGNGEREEEEEGEGGRGEPKKCGTRQTPLPPLRLTLSLSLSLSVRRLSLSLSPSISSFSVSLSQAQIIQGIFVLFFLLKSGEVIKRAKELFKHLGFTGLGGLAGVEDGLADGLAGGLAGLVGEEGAAEARRVDVGGRGRDGGREDEREHEEEGDDLRVRHFSC